MKVEESNRGPTIVMSIDENVDALLRLLPDMEQSLGPDHPDLADYYISLGLLLYHDSRFEEAEELFIKALAMRERLLAVDHPDVAAALNHLGLVYLAQGKYADAEPLFKRALSLQEKVLGP